MGRQLFGDGPFMNPPVAAVGAYTSTTITAMWSMAQFTPVFANDAKAGKIYCVRAGGIMTMSVATCTMIITPKWGAAGTSLGAGPAQTLSSGTNIPWYLQAEVVFYDIGAAGTNSHAVCSGFLAWQGTIATSGQGGVVPFGSTAAVAVDATINAGVEINTTLGGTTGSPSIQTLWAYLFARN
jgi:hypothetical protein